MESILIGIIWLFAIASTADAASQTAPEKALTLARAKKVIGAAVAEAKKLNAPGGAIAVVDGGGNLIAVERLDGTFAASANISIGKARTSATFKRPTKVFEDIINKGRTAMATLSDFTPLQGGVPLTIDGEVVGAVGVSGAASAQQDEELAMAGAQAFAIDQTIAQSSMAGVAHFRADQVTKAFEKGMPLLEIANYKIHASHRDAPGIAEVHSKDTDIIYMLGGSATFVTGGTVVEGENIESDEIRGSKIIGGESRSLSKGDVIVVPHGTPHWFKEINGPLDYYVVKVRAAN